MENEPKRLHDSDEDGVNEKNQDVDDDGVDDGSEGDLWGQAVNELDEMDKENEFNPEDLEKAA